MVYTFLHYIREVAMEQGDFQEQTMLKFKDLILLYVTI